MSKHYSAIIGGSKGGYYNQNPYNQNPLNNRQPITSKNYKSLTISLINNELVFKISDVYNISSENIIKYLKNKLIYYYDSDKEEINDDLKQYLVKILYHKIESEIKIEEKQIENRKIQLKAFSKFFRLDKLKRIIGDEGEEN